jgi:predicted flap endonuclease-1-like 5' DNA nuclease
MIAHIIEMIVMLLVAAILGFLIAWFWQKSKIGKTNDDQDLKDYIEKQKKELDEHRALLKTSQAENKTLKDEKQNTENLLAECRDNLNHSEISLNKEQEALQRIKEKAKNINFDRIGQAEETEKEDLKIINGIGPFIEKKLNALGIYTFKQIANFNDEDKEKVNEAIEFFPGRIKRDDWVGQAKKLYSKTPD